MYRDYNDISYAESPFGTLSQYMTKTFGWMFAGLLVTFATGIGTVLSGLIVPLLTSGLLMATIIGELVLVFVLSGRITQIRPSTATGLFFAYAVLNGLNLSAIFLVYDFSSLILAFLVGAVYFGVMAVYGATTHRDLTGCLFGSLHSIGSVGHDQIHPVGDEFGDDGGTVGGLTLGVLLIKGHLAGQQLLQFVLEALGCGIQRLVFHQLADADGIRSLSLGRRSCGRGRAGGRRTRG